MSIRIWFLIQQFVARNDLPEDNHIPFVEYLHCRRCRNRVALIRDYIISSSTVNDLMFEGFFARLLNFEAAQDERYHHPLIDGITQAEIHCVECRHLLGWRSISVCQSCRSHTVQLFLMRLDELICWNNATFHDFLLGGNNEQAPNDQDGRADEEQYHDQDGDTNEQNADQDGDGNEQDLGDNEQNADQDKDANEQDVGANEQNADRDEGVNEQVPNQNADIADGMGNIVLNANN